MTEDQEITYMRTEIERVCEDLFMQLKTCADLETLIKVSEVLDGIEAFALEAAEKLPEQAHVFRSIVNDDVVSLRCFTAFRFNRIAAAEVAKNTGRHGLH